MKAVLFCISVLLSLCSFAQNGRYDTLTTAEKYEVSLAYRNSCFGQQLLMDSCSKKGDSVAAGNYLMRINPYCIIFDQQTPATLDTYLIRHYSIPAQVRLQYLDTFTKIYNKPKSKALKTFEAMLKEDQTVRNELDTCKDSLNSSLASERMILTDSVHFAYLLRYVHQYGWPSLANGSFQASIIALHDHRHHWLYLPMIKKAVLNGTTDRQVLDLFYYYLSQGSDRIGVILSKYKYVCFDVTNIIKYKMPDNVPEIEKVIKAHCPVRWYWEIEWNKNVTEKDDWYELISSNYPKVIRNLEQEIYGYNCYMDSKRAKYIQEGLWRVHVTYTKNDTTRMYMYITYGDEIKYSDMDILFADSSFATHAIYFDNNKAEIKPESYVFLNELSQWLKSKPALKIEISGHTDNVGKAPANQKLSQDRAEAVKNYLINGGIDAARLSAKGYGAVKPMEPNTTEEGRSMNRRVVFKRM